MKIKIVLADVDEDLCEAFRHKFRGTGARVEHSDLFEVAADAYVSPCNSHGIMDGGLDRLLRLRFPGLDVRLQREFDQLGGLLPVGQAVVVETEDPDMPYIVAAPTMVFPSDIRGTRNVYLAMRAALSAVHAFNEENDDAIEVLAIPGLGTGVGRVPPMTAASQMLEAFEEML
jgi:O-acetyl-ADP-ribose deacetylase (regulator of RNase III)